MATVYTQDGEEKIVDIIDGTATSPTDLGTGNNFIGWGTGVAAADKADAALGTEGAETRVGGTVTQAAADKNQWVGELTCNATPKSITEAGLFDAVTSGVLVIRGVFAAIAVVENDKIEFTFTLEQT
jgi:hypothetical protein